MLDKLKPVAKAVVAFLVPGLLIIAGVLVQGRAPTQAEWLIALGTTLVTGLGVYAVPNKTPEYVPTYAADPDVQ